MAKRKKDENNPNYYRPNAWAALRDVLLTAMGKSQLFVLLGWLTAIIMVCKMPAKDIKEVALKVIELFKEHYIIGWIGTIVLSIGWLIQYRLSLKNHQKEMQRVAGEKSDLQSQGLGIKPGSSR